MENRSIRSLKNEISTRNIVDHPEEDTLWGGNAGKPTTPVVEERISQNKRNQTSNEVEEAHGGKIKTGATAEAQLTPVGARKKTC